MNRILSILLLALSTVMSAQRPVIMHSHNDYDRTAPFWEAYSQHCGSIEADVFLQDGEILVAHNRKDVTSERSLRKMYIEPIVKLFRENGGRMWKGSDYFKEVLLHECQHAVDYYSGECYRYSKRMGEHNMEFRAYWSNYQRTGLQEHFDAAAYHLKYLPIHLP